MERPIKKVNIENNEFVYMRKGLDGWRIVAPIKNEDGSINWANLLYFGNLWKLAKWVVVLAIILAVIWAYNTDVSACRWVASNMDQICANFTMSKEHLPANSSAVDRVINWGSIADNVDEK